MVQCLRMILQNMALDVIHLFDFSYLGSMSHQELIVKLEREISKISCEGKVHSGEGNRRLLFRAR